jgi:hypothetical protein
VSGRGGIDENLQRSTMSKYSDDEQMLYHDEPCPGLDEHGNEVTCNRTICVTKADAIKIQRGVVAKRFPTTFLEPAKLLADYITVHWVIDKE